MSKRKISVTGGASGAEVAQHLDMSPQAASMLRHKLWGDDSTPHTLDEWRITYIRRLRDMASGRSAGVVDGEEIDLATERALLAREQRIRIEMINAEKRAVLIPADKIEPKIRAMMVAAREFWRNEPARIAREVKGMGEDDMRKAMLVAFDALLGHLAGWDGEGYVYDEAVTDDLHGDA